MINIVKRLVALMRPFRSRVYSAIEQYASADDAIQYLTVSSTTSLGAQGNEAMASGREIFRDMVLYQDQSHKI